MGAKKPPTLRVITRYFETLKTRRPVVESALYLGHNPPPHRRSKQTQKAGISNLVISPLFVLIINNIASNARSGAFNPGLCIPLCRPHIDKRLADIWSQNIGNEQNRSLDIDINRPMGRQTLKRAINLIKRIRILNPQQNPQIGIQRKRGKISLETISFANRVFTVDKYSDIGLRESQWTNNKNIYLFRTLQTFQNLFFPCKNQKRRTTACAGIKARLRTVHYRKNKVGSAFAPVQDTHSEPLSV